MVTAEVHAQRLLAGLAHREVLAHDPEAPVTLIVGDHDRCVPESRIGPSARTKADDVAGDGHASGSREAATDRRKPGVHHIDQIRPILDVRSGARPDPVDRPQESRGQLDALE